MNTESSHHLNLLPKALLITVKSDRPQRSLYGNNRSAKRYSSLLLFILNPFSRQTDERILKILFRLLKRRFRGFWSSPPYPTSSSPTLFRSRLILRAKYQSSYFTSTETSDDHFIYQL